MRFQRDKIWLIKFPCKKSELFTSNFPIMLLWVSFKLDISSWVGYIFCFYWNIPSYSVGFLYSPSKVHASKLQSSVDDQNDSNLFLPSISMPFRRAPLCPPHPHTHTHYLIWAWHVALYGQSDARRNLRSSCLLWFALSLQVEFCDPSVDKPGLACWRKRDCKETDTNHLNRDHHTSVDPSIVDHICISKPSESQMFLQEPPNWA